MTISSGLHGLVVMIVAIVALPFMLAWILVVATIMLAGVIMDERST